MPAAPVYAAAFLLDRLVGDPVGLYHPVQAMGAVTSAVRRVGLARIHSPTGRRWLGIALTLGLAGGSAAVGWLAVALAAQVHPWLGAALEVIMLASCFAGRSLADAAREVLAPLEAGDLAAARAVLARYVGRDTEHLSAAEILRAVVETVAENTTDGVTAPLFWAAVGGLPAALAFKAVSTLDSMIGYKEEPYTHFGWFAARTDDWLNWLPARLTALTVALLSGKFWTVLTLVRRDGPKDPSPNSGVSIAAFAAALGVQVGGLNAYRGTIKKKPLLGDPRRPLSPSVVRDCLRLLDATALLWAGAAIVLLGIGNG